MVRPLAGVLMLTPLFLVAAALGQAQLPPLAPPYAVQPTPFPQQVPTPNKFAGPAWPNLLFVRISAPAPVNVTFYRGGKEETLVTPCDVGLRPGYRYRVKISGFPQFPAAVLTPTIEVRGSLVLANPAQAADFPVGLFFGVEDFAKVESGAFVTKVAVVEPPDEAIPQAATAAQPLEVRLLPNIDPWREANNRGRPVLVTYIGPREATADELIAEGIPGTVLFPKEKVLPLPRVLPNVPWAWVPPHDPLLGPRNPNDELKICDGGDRPPHAGFGPGGKLVGVDPADTVAEYVDSKGRKRIACSNRVCLCVPRYVIIRAERYPGEQVALIGPEVAHAARAGLAFTSLLPPLVQHQNIHLEAMAARQRPSGTEQIVGTAVTARVNGLKITASLQPPANILGSCPPPAAVEPPDGCLLIDKWPDRHNALAGDIITFTIRYTNTGGQPMTNVVVTDNLMTRFEYVPGSAKTDREAVFTTQANDAGSATLRWEFPGVLPPGQRGMVSFQVRIR